MTDKENEELFENEEEEGFGDWFNEDGTNSDTNEFLNDDEPDVEKLVRERVEAFETSLVDAIERGDTGNKVYKGLQTRLNERHKENEELRGQINWIANKLSVMEQGQGELGLLSEWQRDILLEALDDKSKVEASDKLERLKSGRKATQQEQFINDLMSGKVQLPQREQQQYVPERNSQARPEADIVAQINAAKEKFIKGKREYAQTFGVNPDDPSIDYGNDDESFFDRQEKFDASLLKILNVKKRISNVTGQRSGLTGIPDGSKGIAVGGDDALSKAANERIRKYFN